MNETDQLAIIRQDLNFIKVKEIQDIIRLTNDLVRHQQRVSGGGRKQDIINRYTTFLMGLLANKKHNILNSIVTIVNQEAHGRFNWGYNNEEIVSSTSRYARPALWQRQNASTLNQVEFQIEPFFKPVSAVTQPKLIPASSSRNTSHFQFQLTPEQIRLLEMPLERDGEAKYQVRFCCAIYSTHTQVLEKGLRLEFPSTCELKINDTVVPNASIRCIKGKPGTIHPANLSTGVRNIGSNNVELLYMQTHQHFVGAVYIMERKTIPAFIQEMKDSRILTKENVLAKLKTTSEDADIVMESETLSMKCPLAFTRIQTPCRSIHCNHLQCFDAHTFLAMNEQTPTWSCPVCYKTIANPKDLAIDEYFSDILKQISSGVESVKVEPDGRILIKEQEDIHSLDDSDEDEYVPNNNNVKNEEAEGSNNILHNYQNTLPKDNAIIILDDDDDDTTNAGSTNDDTDNGNNAQGLNAERLNKDATKGVEGTTNTSSSTDKSVSDKPGDKSGSQPEGQGLEKQQQNSVGQYPLDDPLQIQLQQQIHQQLQQQQQQQPSTYGLYQQPNGYTSYNGYPNTTLPPILPNANKLPVPGKTNNDSSLFQAPPAKRMANENVIDLTFSSDDES